MRNAFLVRIVRGCKGGYLLERPANTINLLEIIELYDGPLEPAEDNSCHAASRLWNRLSQVLREEAHSITVADLRETITAEHSPVIDVVI